MWHYCITIHAALTDKVARELSDRVEHLHAEVTVLPDRTTVHGEATRKDLVYVLWKCCELGEDVSLDKKEVTEIKSTS